MQTSASINLIKTKVNILDEILKWALTVGRLLIIITELVAFTTFIYRFSLDRKLIDLHEKINQEQAIVGSLKDREELYRNLQEKIGAIKTITTFGDRNVKILNDVAKLTPSGISFNSFDIANNKIEIDSSVQSTSSLSNFVSLLRKYPEVSSVSITRIDNQSQISGINVIILVKLKESTSQ